ncbi:hypothetical protein HPB50_024616 [Hyalomma asiaticum]|uniref:Uncharacterized protein n=1 Tax=Hyalomma asiaticum TaxID=266040 RepID=A0ACB7T734_HYAAI|nr:hypothetical protein HPB50_024616 [Hyalomma asiaticum]
MDYLCFVDFICGPPSTRNQMRLVFWRHVWLSRIRRHYVITLLELAGMLLLMSSVWDDSVAPYRARPHKDQFFDSVAPTALWGRRNESWTQPMPFPDPVEAAQYADQGKAPAWPAEDVHRRVAVWFEQPVPDQLTYHVRFPDADFDLHQEYRLNLLVPGPANTDDIDEIS